MTDVFGWLENPSADRGLHFAEDGGNGWSFCSYQHLARLSRSAAVDLRSAGVGPGDTVLLICPTSAGFVAALYGVLRSGAVPSVAATPTAFRDRAAYTEHLGRLLRLVAPRAVVTVPELAPLLEPTVTALGCALLLPPAGATADDDGLVPVRPRRTAVIQFSSGSSGPPRGVRIGMAALTANIRAIGQWLDFDPAVDRFSTWLPLHHDMGLVGSLLFPMAQAADLWLMRPEQFIREPLRWLRTFSDHAATTTTTPMFALGHVLRRVREDDVAGLDLRSWRTLIVGAERVDPSVLDAFTRLLAPAGFDAGAILPAYGLAEATLAVTGVRHAEPVRTLSVEVGSLAVGRAVHEAAGDDRTATFVGCGRPLPGTEVTVVDDEGRQVADRVLGEVRVHAPSLADGYVEEPGTEPEPFDGVLATGDAGFLADGELFVVGRLGDSVKQFGRWVFAEDVERVAASVADRPNRMTCLLGFLDRCNTAAVVIEGGRAAEAERIGRAITRHGYELRVLVLSAPDGWIRRTTSGKPRRRAMWQEVMERRDDTVVCWDSAG